MPILPPSEIDFYPGQCATVWNICDPVMGEESVPAILHGCGCRKVTTYITYSSLPMSTSILIQQIAPDGTWMTVYESVEIDGEVMGDLGLAPRELRAVQNGTATGVTVAFQRW